MSKLDNILVKVGNDVLDLPKTNNRLGQPFDDGKQAIKELMLELIGEETLPHAVAICLAAVDEKYCVCSNGTRNKLRDELRKKVEEL